MLLSLLELAGNKALEYDADSVARLTKLQGKTMTLHIKNFDRSMTITPQVEGIEFSLDEPEQVDVRLSTTLSAIVKISREGLENAELESGELEMAGDPIVGQRFAQVIADLNIDWESLMAEKIGPGPAKAVSEVAVQARSLADESRSRLHQFVVEMIRDDMQLVAGKADVEAFLNDVDDLRADADRLHAKLERLRSKLS